MAITAGERVRSHRKLREWSIRALAERADIHKSVVHRIETGKQEPRASQLAQLAKAFGLSMIEFYGGEVPS